MICKKTEDSSTPLIHLITYRIKALFVHHSIYFLFNTFNLSTLAIPMPPAFAHVLLLKYISDFLKFYFPFNICPPSHFVVKLQRISFLLLSAFGNSLNCGSSSCYCYGPVVRESSNSLLTISGIISLTSQAYTAGHSVSKQSSLPQVSLLWFSTFLPLSNLSQSHFLLITFHKEHFQNFVFPSPWSLLQDNPALVLCYLLHICVPTKFMFKFKHWWMSNKGGTLENVQSLGVPPPRIASLPFQRGFIAPDMLCPFSMGERSSSHPENGALSFQFGNIDHGLTRHWTYRHLHLELHGLLTMHT